MDKETEYICPQCRAKVSKVVTKYLSKRDDIPRRYFCKSCGWTMYLWDKDAESMHKKGVW